MLNKKAIAAFAAGATLLSGFAFAAPAMADSANLPQTAIENAKKQEKADAAELAKKVEENKAKENKAVLDNLDKSKAFDNFLNGSEKGDIVNGSLGTLNGRGAAEVSAARSKANEATAALNALKAKWADMLAQADYLDAEGEHEAAAALRKAYYTNVPFLDSISAATKNEKEAKDELAKAEKAYKESKERFAKFLNNLGGKKADVKKSDKKSDKKAAAKTPVAAAPLAKTGAAVALAAVAASVLAGMGAALRKIRH
ncbi:MULTISPECIES: hypothetical protein [Gardnerella]|uniref:hypothetical protein n=1 Tax=Gardnerella TaxID=2701 RepID=UPI0001D42728|nr:hypothetical protein [Gardnerella leopoldii]EFH27939.1 hypothetical protein GVAMD_1006 [Gardnerella vaginalis AMD]NSX31538.1 hypothetical protein [Gardnerella vaginalis]NSX42115.1 hypothetical protein [Gardnerella vaginalis]NSX44765.1 hypothetical protein [Gardnerella vaginalis]